MGSEMCIRDSAYIMALRKAVFCLANAVSAFCLSVCGETSTDESNGDAY